MFTINTQHDSHCSLTELVLFYEYDKVPGSRHLTCRYNTAHI